MLQKEGVTRTGSVDKIPKASTSDLIPASFAQQRLWFLNELEPGQSIYNIATAFQVTGRLNIQVLEQSLTEIVRRHAVLRTTFAVVAGEPMQAISEPQRVSLPLTDLSHLTAPERELKARQEAAAEARHVFDLRIGPLWRARLLKLDDEEHDFLLTLHHIISDGWSLGRFFKELSILYDAYSRGEESPLEELAVQYADYSVWQRQWLQGGVLEEQLSYWKQQLRGAPPVLELPSDRPRKAASSYRGATESFTLPRELSQQLKMVSQREGTTLFMTLLATFQILLSRYTGQEDIVVGTPYAGREREEIQPLIGFFVNTLVLRTELSGHLTFVEVLQRVREAVLSAHANQDLPFEKLVEELQPERSLGYQPLFQVVFQLQKAARDLMRLEGLQCSELGCERGDAAKVDLVLSMSETETDLYGTVEYKTDLFDRDMIQRLIAHYGTLLAGIVADPQQAISKVPLITQAEQDQLLTGWNDTAQELPLYQCHQLFEQQAAHTPDSIAIIFREEQLTYRELDERANRLAHCLQQQGVGPESLVAILVPRSVEMVVSVLGVLKAGGAYLPLDVAYPPERLRLMLDDSGASVMLTSGTVADTVLNAMMTQGVRLVRLDAQAEQIERCSAGPVMSRATLDNLAYVIYTSGSTGRPKGVMVTHGGVCNMVAAQAQLFQLGAQSRVTQLASFSFDASIFEILLALPVGASLVLVDSETALPGAALLDLLGEEQVTTALFSPSLLAALAEAELPHLQTIIVAGEACTAELVRRWGGGRRFYNAYGPTEATVWATLAQCRDGDQRPTIGRPIVNTQVYLLDKEFEPVPVGVAAELYVGGLGVSRGYLNRAELTAERFLPDPFSTKGGQRLYRTGDRVRYQRDGKLQYLGRTDDQVKIRGFRIELEEIEATLAGHESVREAVVAVHERADGDKQLIAYLVPGETELKTAEVREWLREQLPGFMIPALFLKLDELPLTPTGKIDRRALPSPDPELIDKTPYKAPQTEMEQTLASIWADLLKVGRVGINDNFFELGGHSLLATRMTTRLRETYGIELPMRTVFEAPTIALLGNRLEQLKRMPEQGAVTGIPASPRGEGDLPKLLSTLAQLSEEEVREMLTNETQW
jgi:amino acid adenylation domain-containing protein